MATYKVRALEAIRKLIDKYQKLLDDNLDWMEYTLSSHQDCPLCNVYWKPNRKKFHPYAIIDGVRHYLREPERCCAGCPSANERGNVGCTDSPTFEKLAKAHDERQEFFESESEDEAWVEDTEEELIEKYYAAVRARLGFWWHNYNKLQEMDAELFTPSRNYFFDLDNTREEDKDGMVSLDNDSSDNRMCVETG